MLALAAGDAAGLLALLPVALLLVLPVFDAAGVLTGAGVAGAGVLAGVAGLLFAGALLAASPQAMPRALNPRTVESAITFLILFFRLLSFSKIYLFY